MLASITPLGERGRGASWRRTVTAYVVASIVGGAAMGALLGHITGGHLIAEEDGGKRSFQPMNVNFGLFPPVSAPKVEGVRLRGRDKVIHRRKAMSARALADCAAWLGDSGFRAAAE